MNHTDQPPGPRYFSTWSTGNRWQTRNTRNFICRSYTNEIKRGQSKQDKDYLQLQNDKFDQNFSTEISNDDLQKTDVLELIKNLPNDLTKPAISSAPIIGEILNEMKNAGAEIAKMSGSGSTCFAIFNNETELEIAQKNLTKKFPNFLIRKTRILSNV